MAFPIEADRLFARGQNFLKNNAIVAKLFTKEDSDATEKKPRMDVSTVLQDVDIILQNRTPEDGKKLLNGMVADLLQEIDMLRFRLDEAEKRISRVKEERDLVNIDYKDRLLSLMFALQNSTGDHEGVKNMFPDGKLITADDATNLTVKALTKKIEKLNAEQVKLDEKLKWKQCEIDDLKSDNDAKSIKIAALETQFKSINRKRNKVITKLTDRTNALNLISPVNIESKSTDYRRRVEQLVDSTK